MQAEYPCPLHETQELAHACLGHECKEAKLFCDQCLPMHSDHPKLSFQQYTEAYQQFHALGNQTYNNIKQNFDQLRQCFMLCIKRAEERVIKQFCGNFTPEFFPAFTSVELQQFVGMAEDAMDNPILQQLLRGKSSATISYDIHSFKENLQSKIIDLQSTILPAVNAFAAESQYYISEIQKKERNPDQFFFSKHFKNNLLAVHGDGKVLLRPSDHSRGLTVYGLVDKPLTRHSNKIAFQILKQKQRFIYFGVCNPENFTKLKFMGAVYEKGGGMYAIRQSSHPGYSAVCLHNSLDDFSNKETVGWDFKEGDKLKIEYLATKKQIVLSCNDMMTFEMPLDEDIKEPYPFIGLKYEGQQVVILSNPDCDRIMPQPKISKVNSIGNKKSSTVFSLFNS